MLSIFRCQPRTLTGSGDCLAAPGILLPGEEAQVLDALFAALGMRWTLTLTREDDDSWFSIRRTGVGYESCLTRHGSVGDWQAASADAAHRELLAQAPFNDGASEPYVARLTLSSPP